MGEFLAGCAVALFAVFLYKTITKDDKTSSGGTGGGGGSKSGDGTNLKQK